MASGLLKPFIERLRSGFLEAETPILFSRYPFDASTLVSILNSSSHPVIELFRFHISPQVVPADFISGPLKVFGDELERQTENKVVYSSMHEDPAQAAVMIGWKSINEHTTTKADNQWFLEATARFGENGLVAPMEMVHVTFVEI